MKKDIEHLKQIIRDCKMSTRPEYYSGRGATMSDLTGEILFKIHNRIQEDFGARPGKAFVKLVESIKVLSATAFLNGLYDLYRNNWKLPKQQPSGISVQKNEDGSYNEAHGMVGITSALFYCDRDDTQRIKSHFLAVNGCKPQVDRQKDGAISWYY